MHVHCSVLSLPDARYSVHFSVPFPGCYGYLLPAPTLPLSENTEQLDTRTMLLFLRSIIYKKNRTTLSPDQTQPLVPPSSKFFIHLIFPPSESIPIHSIHFPQLTHPVISSPFSLHPPRSSPSPSLGHSRVPPCVALLAAPVTPLRLTELPRLSTSRRRQPRPPRPLLSSALATPSLHLTAPATPPPSGSLSHPRAPPRGAVDPAPLSTPELCLGHPRGPWPYPSTSQRRRP